MRRILLLITDLEIGGTPVVVRELALRLAAAGGAHIEVACLSPWGPVADQIANAGVTVTALDAKGVFTLPRVLARLVRLIRRERIDTVFSFLIHANATAALAAAVCPGIRWFQAIQTTQPSPRWHWRVQSVVQLAAERIVVPSPSVAHAARRWARVPGRKVVVIPNAISIADLAPAPGDTRRQRSSSNPAHDGRDVLATGIGFIGRLDPIKRIPDLIEAMKMLDDSIHLHIFGEGAERRNIEALIRQLGLASRVTVHGMVARPQTALAQIDLLVLPSQAEGFGLVLIEAMAAGVPIVATDVPGICDVVRHGETGWLVPVASPKRLAEGIALLLKDPGRRAALVARAREDVQRRYSWESVLPCYQRLLGII